MIYGVMPLSKDFHQRLRESRCLLLAVANCCHEAYWTLQSLRDTTVWRWDVWSCSWRELMMDCLSTFKKWGDVGGKNDRLDKAEVIKTVHITCVDW